MKKNIDWVNNAKGIGIILVVFGHVWRGIQAKGLLNNTTFLFIDDIIYSFHMPLFFLISGFFIEKSLSKYSRKELLKNKLKTLMYPYFVWSIIQILVNIILSKYTNNTTDLWAVLKIIYLPIAPFWYLYALFLMYGLAVVMKNFNIKFNIFLAMILYLMPNTGVPLIENLFNFYIYFILGKFIFIKINDLNKQTLKILISLLLFSVSFYTYKNIFVINEIRSYFIPALFGSIAVFSLSKIIKNKLLKRLGKESLVIFLLHIFFAAGTRIFLFNVLKIYNVEIHLLLGLAIGLLGPILFNYFYLKFNLKGLFVYPFKF
mgnify:CR=1 FL=1|tara:strand:+ start:8447 stop:9397 length:951 start_codon:yes stop_codon:yes gene_type:complete